jgi:hypothetical protein
MKLFILSLMLLQLMAHAELPASGAASIASVREHLRWKTLGSDGDYFIFEITGRPEDVAGMDFGVEIDQDQARTIFPKAAVGSVLFARARKEDDRLRVHFSGSPEVLAGLHSEWDRKGNIRRFVKSISVRFAANYSATAVIVRPWAIAALRSDCRPGAKAEMACTKYAGVEFMTPPQCLRDPEKLSALTAAVEIDDPFLNGEDSRVRVYAVISNICDARSTHETWIQGAAETLIFSQASIYDRVDIVTPVVIEVKGEIAW